MNEYLKRKGNGEKNQFVLKLQLPHISDHNNKDVKLLSFTELQFHNKTPNNLNPAIHVNES